MKNTQDLLHGNIKSELIALTIPLVLGNILQQFYNTIDSFIVGRYVGTEAFAGIGVAGSIMNLFIFILNGGCNGMSIIFAELYGQKNYEKLRKESFLSLSAGGGFTIVLSIVSLLVLYPVLGLIQTPPEVEPYVVAYLQIIFIGLPATFLYNWCSAVLRAAGDTETPLWTLFIAMCMNLALDVAFVPGLHMGTAGTALATVIAQLFSAGVCLWIMRKKHPIFFFSRKDMGMDLPLLKRTANFGAVSALHQSSIYIGKMLVQGAVNSGGTEIISAYTATTRIEGFSNSFGDSGSTAISVFVAQNRGAGDKKRALKGFHQGLGLMIIFVIILSALQAALTRGAVQLLMGNPSETVMKNAVLYMNVVSVFYILNFIGNAGVGFFRGIGKISVPVIGSTLHISIRVVLSYLLIGRMGLEAVAFATGSGWISVVLYQIVVYRKVRKQEFC